MIKHFIRAPLAAAALASASLLAPIAAGATSTSAGTSWGTWQNQAFSAVAGYRGDGPLTAGASGPIGYSSVTTPSGPVSVAERTVSAEDNGGRVTVQVTVLGQAQVLVTELSPTAGNGGATLVLRPGSSAVTGTYPVRSADGSPATAAAHRGNGRDATTDAVVRHLGADGDGRLTVTGGCYPTPQSPFVASTTFGPLVDGTGVIDCGNPETLGLIVSIYRGVFTHVGTNQGGTTTHPRTSYAVSTYYFCTHITGTHEFRTSQIWSVNGTDEGGATSSESWLHCT